MTTHIVEIRPSPERRGEAGEWTALTRHPIPKYDADALLRHIGPHWEARVVVDRRLTAAGREFWDFEAELGDVPRWVPVELVHHPDCRRDDDEQWVVRGMVESDRIVGAEWLRYQRMIAIARSTAMAPVIITVGEPIFHIGSCSSCGGAARALSVKVSIALPDATVSTREYAL